MATKKLRKKRIAPPVSEGFRPRESEKSATYWRNCYEAERESNLQLRKRWWEAQDENKELRAQLAARSGRKRVKRLS